MRYSNLQEAFLAVVRQAKVVQFDQLVLFFREIMRDEHLDNQKYIELIKAWISHYTMENQIDYFPSDKTIRLHCVNNYTLPSSSFSDTIISAFWVLVNFGYSKIDSFTCHFDKFTSDISFVYHSGDVWKACDVLVGYSQDIIQQSISLRRRYSLVRDDDTAVDDEVIHYLFIPRFAEKRFPLEKVRQDYGEYFQFAAYLSENNTPAIFSLTQ